MGIIGKDAGMKCLKKSERFPKNICDKLVCKPKHRRRWKLFVKVSKPHRQAHTHTHTTLEQDIYLQNVQFFQVLTSLETSLWIS